MAAEGRVVGSLRERSCRLAPRVDYFRLCSAPPARHNHPAGTAWRTPGVALMADSKEPIDKSANDERAAPPSQGPDLLWGTVATGPHPAPPREEPAPPRLGRYRVRMRLGAGAF